MSTADPIIDVQGVVNRFGDHVVHEDLNLQVHRGEILAIVGGSGSGKSVLLRTIIGLRRPQKGRVLVFGENLLALSPRRRAGIEQRFGVLFQAGALFSSLNVCENVSLPLIEHAGLPRHEAQQVARLKLALAGLAQEVATRMPAALSGGMIKRVALARSLALDPDILFLDEPTAGLDPIGAAAFDRLIRTLRDALGLTVVMITHDLDTLYAISDRIAVLSQRKVLAVGPLAEVAANPDPWIQDYFHGPRGRAAAESRDALRMETIPLAPDGP